MSITRRDLLRTGAGLAIGAAGAGLLRGAPALAQAPELAFTPEDGASLRVLRWNKFVQGDEDQWLANTQKFTETTGVAVKLEAEILGGHPAEGSGGGECRLRPRYRFRLVTTTRTNIPTSSCRSPTSPTISATNTAAGTIAKQYGMRDNEWIGLPLGAAGARMVYRKTWINEAGFEEFPTDTQQILEVRQEAQGDRPPARHGARPRGRRRQRLDALRSCGALAAAWSTRRTRSSSTARRPSRRSNT